MSTVRGKDLKVGDTILVWWRPHQDTITDLAPYTGPYPEFIAIARFALNPVGMTIEGEGRYEVVGEGDRGTPV